jgi:hypothetical protein
MRDTHEITNALEAKGVFNLARLLDPEAITAVAMKLATSPGPNEYSMWLDFYAMRYSVATYALAEDVLIVLSHSAEYVGDFIAKNARSAVCQLVAV